MVRCTLGFAVALSLAAGSTAAAQSQPTAAPAAATVAPADTVALLAFGERITHWFWEAETDSLWARAGEDARTFLRNPTELGNQIYGFISQYGPETSMVSESLVRQGENYRYERIVHLEASDVPWTVAWTIRPDFTIMHLSLDPGE